MICSGYSEHDQWRTECCKLNMQLAIARCKDVCRLSLVQAATSHELTSPRTGAAGESPAPHSRS